MPALANIDGDGDLDAFIGTHAEGVDVRFFQDLQGSRVFTDGFDSGDTTRWSKARAS